MSSPSKKPSFWKIVLSTMAAAFGVQTKKNLEQDFNHGSIMTYIAAGIIFTTLFVVIVFVVVQAVLKSNGF
jgi:ABC-type glycerol-3-phosphate transport system permease component